jgi:5-carboxymethyl-2-hydroxymuconate isomerase
VAGSVKLLTFARAESGAEAKIGSWLDGDIVDLDAALRRAHPHEKLPASLRSLIAAGPCAIAAARRALDAAAGARAGDGIRLRRHEVRLLPPIADARLFFCVGKNNKSHLDELVRNQLIKEIPKEPTGFVKLSSVMVGDDAAVVRPHGITTLDYEPELTFIIGKHASRVAKASVLSYIAGITLTNDLTARQIQKQEVASGTRFWTSKNMPGFGPVGPYIVTLDEVADPHDLWITCAVNGEQRMRVHTGDMIFRIGDVLEHFSRWMPFEPGDLIAMGAPAGVAVGQPNAEELYLRPGDVVEIAIEGFAPLRTRIVGPEREEV